MNSGGWGQWRVKLICVLLAILIWLIMHQAILQEPLLDWKEF